jgi:hypothetical protein
VLRREKDLADYDRMTGISFAKLTGVQIFSAVSQIVATALNYENR